MAYYIYYCTQHWITPNSFPYSQVNIIGMKAWWYDRMSIMGTINQGKQHWRVHIISKLYYSKANKNNIHSFTYTSLSFRSYWGEKINWKEESNIHFIYILEETPSTQLLILYIIIILLWNSKISACMRHDRDGDEKIRRMRMAGENEKKCWEKLDNSWDIFGCIHETGKLETGKCTNAGFIDIYHHLARVYGCWRQSIDICMPWLCRRNNFKCTTLC